MIDALLTKPDREEALSRTYAHAVATQAGYVTAEYSQDRDSVDLRIQAGGAMRPALDLQLKATVNLIRSDKGYVQFPLKRKNYDQLRIDTQTPRLLVVLDLPKEEHQWMTITENELVLRHRAYWLNLKGWNETVNQTSVTVRISEQNIFNVENLRALMEQSRQGSIQ